MRNPVVNAAMLEAERLKQELLASEVGGLFREFLRAQEVIRMYTAGGVPSPMMNLARGATFVRQPQRNTEAARIIGAAQAYLEKVGRRAASSEIADAIMKEGVEIGGRKGDEASRLSAYLSAAKFVFDNVRGQGYGLRSAGYAGAALPEPSQDLAAEVRPMRQTVF
jgi:hypothetical protein